ncbi:MAG: SIMPL domain-containing protein [Dysgonamonadaceae bacterium]|nr:SIMPL domain-containing protein [Dysgonamonadaceae bacterium]
MNSIKILILFLITISGTVFAQTKNFIDLPYIETSASVDTLVVPDRIYLSIILTEKDTKGKISLEEFEQRMIKKLIETGIDLSKQLEVSDLSSDYKKYALKRKDILKAKTYSLLVYDAKTAMKVLVELEKEEISNISLEKTEHSQIENLKLELKNKAVYKAKQNALYMAEVLNQKVGSAVYISDLGSKDFDRDVFEGRLAGIVVSGYSAKKFDSEDIDIEINKIKIKVEVNVKFKLEE